MNEERIRRYLERIKQNIEEIEKKTDRIDILSITDIAKENLRNIKSEIKR